MEKMLDLPDSLEEDLNQFREKVEQFKDGSVPAAEFRAFRVPQGVYEERTSGNFMLRVRLPAGAVLPHQMRMLASVARKHGNGVLHVTTRQDIQIHRVPLDGIHPALVELYGACLSTKGGGGNTVRNITACCDAGVCAREAFDVTPHAVALTEFLLPDPLSFRLPRKYKIGISGCPSDCAGATVNDLGFIAKRRDGEPGFTAYVGGGMGAHSRVADLLEAFVPADRIHLVAEAVKRVFDKHGNRKNKHRARLRFLIEQVGLDRFRAWYEAELAELGSTIRSSPRIRQLPMRCRPAPEAGPPTGEGFTAWREHNAVPQKQDGFYLVHVPLHLGDIRADMLERLADVVEQRGEGMARATQNQNLVIRWVHEDELAALHQELADLNLADTAPPIIRNVVACTGAATCRLGVCLSRGLASAVVEKINSDGLNLDTLGELNIRISGCPNACGRHPVAHLGFFGAARRVQGRLVPYYVAQLGGQVAEGQTRLAQGKEAIPGRAVPAFVLDFLRAFQGSPEYPHYDAFLEAGGRKTAAGLMSKYRHVPSFEEDKNYYFEWGAETLFSLAGRGPGECGAGVFDLIEVDLASAEEALAQGRCFAATSLAARALLVTRGEQAGTDLEALRLFQKHFVEQDLVDKRFEALMDRAAGCVSTPDPEQALADEVHEVAALLRAVRSLYENMDDSLRFPACGPKCCSAVSIAPEEPVVARSHDFRGVACPLNYVKTKLALDRIERGQVVSVLLDEEGARNVPASAAADGHEVVSVEQEGDHWRILIRKQA